MAIVVRRATSADAEAVSALNADVQAIHAAALPWRFKPPGPKSFSASEASILIARPDNFVFVADVDREAVGYAYAEVIRRAETPFHYAHEQVHLHHISIRPRYRRQGIGKALLDAVRCAGMDQGITLLTLDVWSFNAAARRFFRQHGFTQYNERLWNGEDQL